jgi:hypothetical protein
MDRWSSCQIHPEYAENKILDKKGQPGREVLSCVCARTSHTTHTLTVQIQSLAKLGKTRKTLPVNLVNVEHSL